MVMPSYKWSVDKNDYELELVHVAGTAGVPYMFGRTDQVAIEVSDLYVAATPVTQALWTHVTGSNPATKDALAVRSRIFRGNTSTRP